MVRRTLEISATEWGTLFGLRERPRNGFRAWTFVRDCGMSLRICFFAHPFDVTRYGEER